MPRASRELLEWPDFRPVILEGEISTGAVLQHDGLYVYSEEDIFGEPRVRRRDRARRPRACCSVWKSCSPDDFVVHIDHGIGKYRGLKHLKVAGHRRRLSRISNMPASDTMYVPVERINLVQRYVGGDGAEPKLDRLGGGSWEKVKKRTREAVLAMASELLEIYAAREVIEGHAFPHPGRRLSRVRRAFRVRGDARSAGRDRRRDPRHDAAQADGPADLRRRRLRQDRGRACARRLSR